MNTFALHVIAAACTLAVTLDMSSAQPAALADAAGAPPPQHLRDTGLFVDGSHRVRPENLPFTPQYPLWSDGARKRRWLYLPPGAAIDASNPDAWEFPPGTRLWKEFSHDRPVETRFIERRADGSWHYAAYIWNADGTDAVLAPAEGVAALPVSGAPDGRYAVPAEADCRACHEGAAVPVLGVGALQLSPDRDPLAAHAEPVQPGHLDLSALVARGMVINLPESLRRKAPRVDAPTPAARAALGYMHGNCGHCHNDAGPLASLELVLAQQFGAGSSSSAKVLGSTIGESSRYRPHDKNSVTQRIVPGAKNASVLALRMQSRNPLTQMPPLGTRVADAEGIALIERWIHHELQTEEENSP